VGQFYEDSMTKLALDANFTVGLMVRKQWPNYVPVPVCVHVHAHVRVCVPVKFVFMFIFKCFDNIFRCTLQLKI
jgi:hypothetical protein